MEMVCGLDLHRSQITFRTVDLRTGEVQRGKIHPGARDAFRDWPGGFEPGTDAHFALEGTTGWRFAVEEIERLGYAAHLADPAELSERRGPKRRAKTDHADCELMVNLVLQGRLPESSIPPAHILELRALVRLRKTLVDQRIEWQQRLQAQLFHQGVVPGLRLCNVEDRRRLGGMEISPAGRQMIGTGLVMLDHFDAQLNPLSTQLVGLAKAQPGCRALEHELYGVGWLTAVAIVAELGDCRRFHSADQAVRASGLDITVYESNAQAPGWPPGPAGSAGAALGAVRGGPVRRPEELAGPRLLPQGQGPHRPQPGLPVGGPQDLPPGLPHPQGPRRRRHGATRAGIGSPRPPGCLRSFGEGARPAHHQDDDLPPGSRNASAARVPTLGDLQRSSGRSCAWGPPPSTIVSPGHPPEHRDKTGRPAHFPPPDPVGTSSTGGAYGLILLLLPAGSSCCSPPTSRSFVLAALRALHLDPCVAQQEPCSHEGRRGNRQQNALDLGPLYS